MFKTVRAFMYSIGPDGITGQPVQFSFGGNNGDGEAAVSAGILDVENYPMLLNAAGTFDRQRAAVDNADAVAVGSLGLPGAMARLQAFNGATWDRVRTANAFKGITTAAAGATAVWTPAAGKKFRLMRYMIQFSPDATLAVAGPITATLQDGATNLPFFLRSYYTAAIAANAPIDNSGWVWLDNGYLSAAANNVLNVSLSVALASGVCSVFAIGTEE